MTPEQSVPPISTCVTIRLSNGRYALVDIEDEERVRAINWQYARNAGGIEYAKAHPPGGGRAANKKIYMHRFILGARPGELVDHINFLGLDNRRCNLRIATPAQNCMNQRPQNGKRYKGAKWLTTHQAFQSLIVVEGRSVYLGLYASEEAAARAYDAAARQYFGDFAKLNFPDEFIIPPRLNRNSVSSSGFRGAYKTPTGKFVAMIGHQGRQLHLGVFETVEDAARAYDQAARQYLGTEAHLNFPDNVQLPGDRCSRRQNGSQFKGVYPKGRRFAAAITANRKSIHLGMFDSQEDAARAYDAAALEHFGEFARTNATSSSPTPNPQHQPEGKA